jgi:hypothetical protein
LALLNALKRLDGFGSIERQYCVSKKAASDVLHAVGAPEDCSLFVDRQRHEAGDLGRLDSPLQVILNLRWVREPSLCEKRQRGQEIVE